MLSPIRFPQTSLRLLVVAAMVVLLACSVSVETEGETPQSRALIDRMPAGATAIAWIDIEALAAAMPAEQWAEYQGMIEEEDNLKGIELFAEATGIDLRTDLYQVGVALMPGGEDGDPLALLSVGFDRDRLETFLADADSIAYEGRTLYSFEDFIAALETERGSGEEAEEHGEEDTGHDEGAESQDEGSEDYPAYIVVLDDKTLAIGTESTAKLAIDVDAGRGDALKMDPRMNDLISDVAGEGQIWLVATQETWDQEIENMGDTGAIAPTGAIESIQTVTMSMRYGDGIALRLAGISTTNENATLLAESLNGWVALGKMMMQQSEPDLFNILDRGLNVGVDGTTLFIEAMLSEADLEVLRLMVEEQAEGMVDIGS